MTREYGETIKTLNGESNVGCAARTITPPFIERCVERTLRLLTWDMNKIAETYEQDFYAWAMRNVELLRQGRLSEIDVEHVAEELEIMGKGLPIYLGRDLG